MIRIARSLIYVRLPMPSGAGKSPQRTYCYFIHALADGTEQRIPLGADGQAYPGANRLMAHSIRRS